MKGFTLIELIIVVAIIGIMMVVSVPIYQSYVARSQLSSAVAELNVARIQYELVVEDGAATSSFTTANIFESATASKFCTYLVYSATDGVANPALECKLKNVLSSLVGESVYLNRQQDGTWSCSTSSNVPTNFKPKECS